MSAAFKVASPVRARLQQRCGSFDLDWVPSSNVGVLQLRWQSEVERADDCVLGVLEELPRMASAFTDDDLKTAFQQTEGSILRAREEPEVLASDLAQAWAAGDVSQCLDVIARLAAVDRKDITRLVDRFIVGRPFVLGVSLPPTRIAAGMNEAHFQSLVARKRATRVGP